MAHLIDKSVLVTEINRKRNYEVQWMQRQGYTDYNMGLRDGYTDILSYIESLEVKDVELEKEYKDFVEKDPVYNKLVNGIVGKAIAKHFFELGLSVNSPITAADRGKAEETIKEVCEWLDDELCCYIKAQDFTIDHARLNKDLRKHLEGEI